jgi:hypothetical protein
MGARPSKPPGCASSGPKTHEERSFNQGLTDFPFDATEACSCHVPWHPMTREEAQADGDKTNADRRGGR